MKFTVSIISWEGFDDKAAFIAKSCLPVADQIFVVHSTSDFESPSSDIEWIEVSCDKFFGGKFKKVLDIVDTDILLLIQADAVCVDWATLCERCKQCFRVISNLGIWSPEIIGTYWTLDKVLIGDLGAGLKAVLQTDAIVLGLTKDIITRLRSYDYTGNNLGWGIDWAAICYARQAEKLVVRDTIIQISHKVGSGYQHSTARLQMMNFLHQMCPLEQQQFMLLTERLKLNLAHHVRQSVIPNTEDKLLEVSDPYVHMEVICTQRSEHYVSPTDFSEAFCSDPLKITAFYLPQFHTFPENDSAWGKGFTEWTNVARAHSHFVGHLQPYLPSDLGYYDLNNEDTILHQIELARTYGVSAFCFHYYWFSGLRLMRKPLDLFMKICPSKFRFSICWANESWTRRWDGGNNEVILPQIHGFNSDRNFVRDSLSVFSHPSYQTIGGKKILIIYRPGILGRDLSKILDYWRAEAARYGIGELLLLGTSCYEGDFLSADAVGLDGIVQFPPHRAFSGNRLIPKNLFFNKEFHGKIDDYDEANESLDRIDYRSRLVIPGVFPSWDNTARKRGASHIFVNSSPKKFKHYLKSALNKALQDPLIDGNVFVNAWNEWAEGAVLEPSRWYGHAYLNACKEALSEIICDIPRSSFHQRQHNA